MRVQKFFATIAISALAILFSLGASPANASEKIIHQSGTVPTSAQSVPLEIDCSTVTQAGRKYAVDHNVNICGILSKKSGSTITPLDSIDNSCGEAHIYMYDSSYYADADIEWGVTSSVGEIISYDLYAHYDGQADSGVVPDDGWWPGFEHENSATVYTGTGSASADLTGTVETLLYTCTVLDPASGAYIS
ncbi:hypothetical protein [Microbacterium sp. MMO-10]|uniref:hypothetical protein n=1 Tax=Microbacterium sp. MMO-10 TaxID=3081272 RepID=UPI00301927E9